MSEINPGGGSKVYFASLRLSANETLPAKLIRLCQQAGLADIDFRHKFTAIKMHFGEDGNLAYLRPNYAKVVVDMVKGMGGRPYLTDCNTLYPGRRKNALEHLDLAFEHGFSPFSTGCQILIGDGLDGTDEQIVAIPGGKYLQEARIGRAVMDADILISLTHFKGHVETGFGGTLKNIGMGCASRAGKMALHSCTGPKIRSERCIACHKCSRFCAQEAISYPEPAGLAVIDMTKCVECGNCIGACPADAIRADFDEASELLGCKIAEYTKAVLAGRPSFHISLVIDVSPLCDCWSASDLPIVPSVGFFASLDPVALDAACVDAVNAQPVQANSVLADALGGWGASLPHEDYFAAINPHGKWPEGLAHAEAIGLGTRHYELIEI